MTQRIRQIRIESAQNIQLSSDEIQHVVDLIEALDASVPLTDVTVTTLGPLQYRYKLDFADGREWTQVITQANGQDTDPSMTFAVPAPGLRLSEFTSQRELRQAIINMIAQYGLSLLVIDFN